MSYLLLKYLHIVCVATSFSLFFVRGMWVMRTFPPAQDPWIKALPHVVDTLILVSAAGMLYSAPTLGWPGWLQVKIALVVVYVALALVVFRFGHNRIQKAAAWVLGLGVYLFITTIAVLQHPYGVWSLF